MFLSITSLSALILFAAFSVAQQNDARNPPGDIKPAQARSPAANPSAPNTNRERTTADQTREATERTRDEKGQRGVARGDSTTREGALDRELAACLLTKNKGEVELGNYVVKHVKDRDVKEFAEQMVKDHSDVVGKLEQFIGSQEPNDRRTQIAREIDEECLASLKKELGEKSGKEFDACYIGSQISGHMQMAATLKVLSNHTSGELLNIVKDARPTVDKHLDRAKELMRELSKTDGRSQASKERHDTKR